MLTSLLLAYTLSDFYGTSSLRSEPAPVSTYSLSTGAGELEVYASTPDRADDIVARGQTRVPMLTLQLSASCDADLALNTIDLTHFGLGSVTDIRSVYALSGFRRVSRAASFSKDGMATLRLQRMSVEACDTETIDIVADFSTDSDAAGEHGVSLAATNAVESSASRTLYTSEEQATQTVKSSPFDPGAITVRMLPQRVNMLFGTIQTIARLQVSADQDGAHVLRSITLTNAGSARGYDFIDMVLEDRRGNVLTRLTQHMDERTVTFTFDPTYILDRGDTVVLLLRGEIRTSYAKTVDFEIEEESDIVSSPYRRRVP